MKKSFDFGAWLDSIGLTRAEYARLAGLTHNTVSRRTTGNQRCGVSSELELLYRALLEAERPRAPRDAAELLRRAKRR